MGGGWHRQGSGVPLSERVRDQGPDAPPARTAADVLLKCPARHCWVGEAADGHGVKRPGLLVEWRQGPHGWEGLVLYAAHLRPDAWSLVEEWLPAGLLTPS